MLLEEFFNPRLKAHLQEYRFLQENGHWREGFVPDDVECDSNSVIKITFIICNLLVDIALGVEYGLEYLECPKPVKIGELGSLDLGEVK